MLDLRRNPYRIQFIGLNMNKLLFIVLMFSIQLTALAADQFSTLEERMTGKEFKETGLVKLTDEELAVLNDWLRRHSVATLENAKASPASSAAVASGTAVASTNLTAAEDMRGFENQPKGNKEDNVIHSYIVGTFDGWKEEGALFKLGNGMIWQQSEHETFHIQPVENPEVTIKKGFMNSWSLSVVGYNSKVSVKRIQ
jgi:hypothetical protein